MGSVEQFIRIVKLHKPQIHTLTQAFTSTLSRQNSLKCETDNFVMQRSSLIYSPRLRAVLTRKLMNSHWGQHRLLCHPLVTKQPTNSYGGPCGVEDRIPAL